MDSSRYFLNFINTLFLYHPIYLLSSLSSLLLSFPLFSSISPSTHTIPYLLLSHSDSPSFSLTNTYPLIPLPSTPASLFPFPNLSFSNAHRYILFWTLLHSPCQPFPSLIPSLTPPFPYHHSKPLPFPIPIPLQPHPYPIPYLTLSVLHSLSFQPLGTNRPNFILPSSVSHKHPPPPTSSTTQSYHIPSPNTLLTPYPHLPLTPTLPSYHNPRH